MHKRERLVAVAAILIAVPACTRKPIDPPAIAITHVSVVDVESGRLVPDQTIVVAGNRIVAVGDAAGVTVPPDAQLIDGRGKFLIPGLWDMHIHPFLYVFSDFAGPLLIANGVTGARDMGYYIDTTLRWKAEVAAGREIGPRLVIAARVDGPVNKARFVSHVATEEDGARAVDTLAKKKDGSPRADFIKIFSWIPREAYFGLAREARKLGVTFAGHVPYSVSLVEASDSGQKSIEHEDNLMRACSSRDSALRARLADTTLLGKLDPAAEVRTEAALLRGSFDAARCRSVIATLARNNTWVTPTLTVYQPYARLFDSTSTRPDLLQFVPGIVQGGWRRRRSQVVPADSSIVTNYFSFERTGELHRAGVKLLSGTDAPLPYVYPGFSLHDELALLVASGLTPAEALRTATYNPAEFLGALDSLGSIRQGKVADLVLLDADPLADIRNTRRVRAVIANGRLFDSTALAKLLEHVRAAVAPRRE